MNRPPLLATPPSSIRLVIADDHSILRAGIKASLAAHPFFTVVGEATTSIQASEVIERLVPDVALLDLDFPDGNGIDLIRHLAEVNCPTRILLFSAHEEEALIREAIRSGAAGYLLKGCSPEDLCAAVLALTRQGHYLDPKLADTALGLLRGKETPGGRDRLWRLSPQEQRIIPLVAEGKTNKEIGLALNLSEKTVKNYIVRMFQKLGITRRSQAAALYASAVPAHRRQSQASQPLTGSAGR